MSSLLALASLVGSALFAAYQSGPDPLGDALARELHKEVDHQEPTITCTPEAPASHTDKETSC